ncbi:MAG: AMP-binding protein [Bacteroidia bacterium]|nr:AMP-binding protein [Bacteroidia bacterium]
MYSGFLRSCKISGSKPAIKFGENEYSYSTLLNILMNIASGLKYGEPLIGIYTENNVYTYASILAVLLNGSGFVPVNQKFPAERQLTIINETGLKTILCSASSVAPLKKKWNTKINKLNFVENDIISDYKGSYALSHRITNFLRTYELRNLTETVEKKINPDSIAYVLFTSGSTGTPKGRTIIDNKINIVAFAPSAIAYLKQFKILESVHLPYVRHTLFTGEALTMNLIQEWQKAAPNSVIENAYGPTEASVWSFIYHWQPGKSETETINGLVPIGTPLANIEYKIVDTEYRIQNTEYRIQNTEYRIQNTEFHDCPDNVEGELVLGGEQITSGYWKNQEKTSSSFYLAKAVGSWQKAVDKRQLAVSKNLSGLVVSGVELYEVPDSVFKKEAVGGARRQQLAKGSWQNKKGKNENRWYLTGDIVIKNSVGNLVYIKRRDQQVQINGFRVEPGEIEYRLKALINNELVVVIPYQNTAGITSLVCFIRGEYNKQEIRNGLIKYLPDYMLPEKIIFVDEMPLNNSGKIDRVKLREMI